MPNESPGTRPEVTTPQPPHSSERTDGGTHAFGPGGRPYAGRRHGQDFALQRRIAAGVGWFGIGLGLLELTAPRTLARLIGLEAPSTRWRVGLEAPRTRWRGSRRRAALVPQRMRGDPVHLLILRAIGAREILNGAGILARPRPAAWLWARVAGDMMDLSLLGLALNSYRTDRTRLATTTAAITAVAALDIYAGIEFTRAQRARRLPMTIGRSMPLEASITIDRTPDECYRFWHDFENLPRFMRSIESVRLENDRRSHWVARAPGGIRVEWDSEIIDDTPDRLISWRSLNADVPNAGSVHFDLAPDGRSTIVRVRMSHDMPTLSGVAAKLFGKVPQRRVRDDLRRFKQIMETGEIPTVRRWSSGRWSPFARASSSA